MTKTLTAIVASMAMAVAVLATPTTAEARWGWRGPGFFGGLIAGSIIGGAIAGPYGYGPGPYYGYGPGYPPGRCVRPVWNGYRWVRAYVC